MLIKILIYKFNHLVFEVLTPKAVISCKAVFLEGHTVALVTLCHKNDNNMFSND